MTLALPLQVGSFRCHLLDAGKLWLDGGAMFGVVPWTLWSKRVTVDERRRIPLAMRCLLVEHPDGLVLVDTGLGNKEDAKFLDVYGVSNAGDPGPTRLEDAIRAAGHQPDDVRWVINTHLHFDHAGGNTALAGRREGGKAGGVQPSPGHSTALPLYRLCFPQATYVVQAAELDFARRANERIRASYLPQNFEPVAAAGKWQLIEGDLEILPGIRSRLTPGHVPFHQSILIQSQGEVACFLADVMPTSAHLPLAWIMGYDLEPLRTLEAKRALLADALTGGWRFIFEHDPEIAVGRVVPEGKGAALVDTLRQSV